MDTFGHTLTILSDNNSELAWLIRYLDKKLEGEAYRGRYTYTICKVRHHLVSQQHEKELDEEVFEHFKELVDYYLADVED